MRGRKKEQERVGIEVWIAWTVREEIDYQRWKEEEKGGK